MTDNTQPEALRLADELANAAPPVQVPNSIRVPLDSLHADAEYLLARLLAGTLTREQVVGVIRDRIDAARLEIEALRARCVEPAGAQQPGTTYAGLPTLFREALAWGMTYGPEIPAHQWDEMRESMVKQYTERASHGQAPAQAAPAAVAVPEPERSKPRRFLSWACPVCCASVETTP
jgi:hypothetical protein